MVRNDLMQTYTYIYIGFIMIMTGSLQVEGSREISTFMNRQKDRLMTSTLVLAKETKANDQFLL